MGKMFKIYLFGDCIYSCSTCRTHLAKHDQIVSKVRAPAHLCACVMLLTLFILHDEVLTTWLCVCVCVCACVPICVCVCVSVCVCKYTIYMRRRFRADMVELSFSAMCKCPPTTQHCTCVRVLVYASVFNYSRRCSVSRCSFGPPLHMATSVT